MASSSPPLFSRDYRRRRFDDFTREILDERRDISTGIRGIQRLVRPELTLHWKRIDTVRYNTLFVIPYAVNMVLIIIFAWFIQHDQDKLKAMSGRLCDSERSMYSVIANGLRHRAQIEENIHLPAIEGNAKNMRAQALLLEADEMDRVSWSLPDCPAIKK